MDPVKVASIAAGLRPYVSRMAPDLRSTARDKLFSPSALIAGAELSLPRLAPQIVHCLCERGCKRYQRLWRVIGLYQ